MFEFLNSRGYDLALDYRVKIRKQLASEDGQSEPEPKKRIMTASDLIEGLETH